MLTYLKIHETYNKYDADLYGKYVDEYNVKTHMTRENKSVFQCPYKMSVQMSIISAIKTRGKSSRKPQAEETCKLGASNRTRLDERKGGLKQAKNKGGAVSSKRGCVSAWRRLEDATLR